MAQCWNARKAVADAENMLFRVGQHVELFEHPWHSLGKTLVRFRLTCIFNSVTDLPFVDTQIRMCIK